MALFNMTKENFFKKWKLRLPLSIVFRYPVGTAYLQNIQSSLMSLIDKIPLANLYKKWILFVLCWVPMQGRKVKQLLYEPLHNLHNSTSKEECNCVLYSGITKIEGCIFMRHPKEIKDFSRHCLQTLYCKILEM